MTDKEIQEKTIKHLENMIARVKEEGYVITGYTIDDNEQESQNNGEFKCIHKVINLEISVYDMVGFDEDEAAVVISKFM